MILNYKIAKNKLLTGDINGCQQFFSQKGYILESAYTFLLEDNLEKAKELFSLISREDVRAKWALIMISFIEGTASDYPSYFMIRNFLETDLNILIKYYKGDYVEKIIRYCDYLSPINPEVYKFTGRVLWNNDLKEQAKYFFDRGVQYFYNDPELHFLIAGFYLDKSDMKNALHALNCCLEILPEYYPAKELLNSIKSR